jgi:hypothetical protein
MDLPLVKVETVQGIKKTCTGKKEYRREDGAGRDHYDDRPEPEAINGIIQ